ncbi:MAG: GNAT family N-acetyltransferase [Pseudomonas sp.]
MLNHFRCWRERGWSVIDAQAYAQAWQRLGGSVITHPQIVERLSDLAGLPVRYLGWVEGDQLVAALPTWGRDLALSRDALKRAGKRGLFDLGNAEVILPLADQARVPVRHRMRYVSERCKPGLLGLVTQKEGLALARHPDEYSKKFRYNQRRELRLLEEAGGTIRPMAELSAAEQAAIYTELFQLRWGFDVPGKQYLEEVFKRLREFMSGSLIYLNDRPIAIQVLYQVESPGWISVEYVNGGVHPLGNEYSAGSVLSFVNTQHAWEQATAKGKPLRYSFGRADRSYKDRWCNNVEVFRL